MTHHICLTQWQLINWAPYVKAAYGCIFDVQRFIKIHQVQAEKIKVFWMVIIGIVAAVYLACKRGVDLCCTSRVIPVFCHWLWHPFSGLLDGLQTIIPMSTCTYDKTKQHTHLWLHHFMLEPRLGYRRCDKLQLRQPWSACVLWCSQHQQLRYSKFFLTWGTA